MDDSYREFLIKTVLFLEEASGNLFAQILNLASHNEFPMLRENFESGEIFNFNIRMFENTKDVNVLKLIELYTKIENERLNIIEINKITEEELDHYFASSDVSINDYDDDENEDLFGDFPLFLN
ncbi:hypothetical protein EG240_09610 [Paenimyroides tangerinum]|uniref:Uncharacterized protein n=1 Tax=Paenimyroides tangerinum TaxID=2488728 RepID=A0A3P3W818_9FLAO|nr:hypothetical protein [Paenimyroides tangerinum]RRJ90116.1 hypothetical protein EG240_09610 [Paenimyroides tangerinum]